MSETPTRRLSAIMFADIAGYTALMQSSENDAVRSRDRFRLVLAEAMAGRRGEAVQHYGDGTLSTFESAVEAAESAVEVQRALSIEPHVPLRIGIHVGDIVRDNEGVYGDGVNIAARIQSMAHPGSVLMSGRVADEVRNHAGLPLKSLGRHELKNVSRPVDVYAIAADGLVVPDPKDLHSHHRRGSIAVLPFVNMTASTDTEYFSDGITEEIINVLARYEDLQVTSRTSSFSFKGRQEDIRSVAEALDVEHVVEGSVRTAGERVRVTAQLIDARTGYHLFSENFNRSLKDVFEIQDEIAEAIASSLHKTLRPAKSTTPAAAKAKDLTSYNLYLKGRFHWNQWSPEGAFAAIKHYRQAIERSPEFAAPHAGIATAYAFLGALGRLPSVEAYGAAKEAGRRAAELDSASAEAHLALGLTALLYDWDAHASRKHFEIALALKPGLADIRHYYGVYHQLMGNPSASLVELQKARDMDPLSLPINNQLAEALGCSGQHEAALEQYQRTLELNPSFRAALEGMGWALAFMGRIDDSIDAFKRYAALSPTQFAGAAQLGYVYGRQGDFNRAIEYQQRLEERERSDPQTNLDLDFAVLYLGLGKLDWVFARLERAVEARMGGVVFLGASPMWEQVADHPRFRAVLDRIGLWDAKEAESAVG